MREFIVFNFLFLLHILAQTMNSRTHEPREYRGNMMPADISTLTVTGLSNECIHLGACRPLPRYVSTMLNKSSVIYLNV